MLFLMGSEKLVKLNSRDLTYLDIPIYVYICIVSYYKGYEVETSQEVGITPVLYC